MGAAISARHCGMHRAHVWIPTALNTHKERWGKPLSAFSFSFRHHFSYCSLKIPILLSNSFRYFWIRNAKEFKLNTNYEEVKCHVTIIKKKNKTFLCLFSVKTSNYKIHATHHYDWPYRPKFHTTSNYEQIRHDGRFVQLLISWMAHRPLRSMSPAAMSNETSSSQLKICMTLHRKRWHSCYSWGHFSCFFFSISIIVR